MFSLMVVRMTGASRVLESEAEAEAKAEAGAEAGGAWWSGGGCVSTAGLG